MESSIDIYRKYLESERQLSPNTVKAYMRDIEQFSNYINGNNTEPNQTLVDPKDATRNDIRSWIMLQLEGGANPVSINRRIASLHTFYKLLLRKEINTTDPTETIQELKTAHPLPTFIPKKDINQIKNLSKESHVQMSYSDFLDYAVVITLYMTGMRRSELAALEHSMVDFGQMTIKITGKGSKQRIIPLTEEMEELLKSLFLRTENEIYPYLICVSDKNFVFLSKKAKPITTNQIYTIVKRTLKKHGIEGNPTPHTLRHTFATHLMTSGAQIRTIQSLLGHSSIAATEKYTHLSIEELKKTFKKAHPRA